MTLDSLLTETFMEWADDAQIPHDLADRALTGRVPRGARRRSTTIGLAAAATVAVIAGGVFVPRLLDVAPPAARYASPPVPVATLVDPTAPVRPPAEVSPSDLPASLDIHADTENAPAKRLIAAGRIAVSGYYVAGTEKIGKNSDRSHDIWYLYNPGTGTYEATDWATLDVAPGLAYAAVLERDLPVHRVGILDMTTRDVRWIDLDQPVAYVSWSPDGTKILVTSSDRDPSIRTKIVRNGTSWSRPTTRRLGFYIVDAASGNAAFHQGAGGTAEPWAGIPFRWNLDGTLVSEPNDAMNDVRQINSSQPQRLYYDLEGRPHAAPEHDVDPGYEAGYSPDGRLYAGVLASQAPTVPPELQRRPQPTGPETWVTDVASGRLVGAQEMLQLLAWADDDHLIGLQCLGTCKDEFDSRLVVVTLDGSKSVALSGEMLNSEDPGSWHPLLTRR